MPKETSTPNEMVVPRKHTNLWNDLPEAERKRLAPHLMESQILHIWQVEQKVKASHKKLMRELQEWRHSLQQELRKYD